jgi:type IV fimbrial biogenesis protein FimT
MFDKQLGVLEMKTHHAQTSGFTLIELLVTISIIAIAMAIAVPSMTAFMRNAELTSVANSLLTSVNTARSEAMKRGMNAMIKPNDSTDWRKGWVVFVDVARDGDPTNTTNIKTSSQPELPSYFDVTGFNAQFDASGYARATPPATSANGTFVIQRNDLSGADQLDQTRKVIVDRVGRVRVCKPKSATDPDC